MILRKMTMAAAALAMSGTAAFAGGLSAPVADVVIAPPPPPAAARGSMGSLGGAAPFLIGALVIGVAVALSDSGSGT